MDRNWMQNNFFFWAKRKMCCKGKSYVFCSVPAGFNQNPKVPNAFFFMGLTSVFWYVIGISDSMWKSSVYFSSTVDYSPVCANCPSVRVVHIV